MKPLILIFSLASLVFACQNAISTKKNSNRFQLKLQFNSFAGVGYGHVYNCTVLEVLEGDFKEDSLLLTILAGDQERYDKIENRKEEHLCITFQKHKEQEPYQTMPISGIVDKNKTSWLIIGIEE